MEKSIHEFCDSFLEEIYQSAQELFKEPMPALPQELFGLYEKTGDRQIYDGFYLTRRKYLAVAGLLALAEKRDLGYVPGEHIEKLSYIMEEICQEECWAVPAHVDRTRADWRVTADLFACETAQTLSELSDRLSEELPERIRDTVAENIEKRVFTPFFSSDTPPCWWEGCNTNWNAVCAGSIGSACLHLLKQDKARLEICLKRVIKSLVHYIDGFAEDGICLEGIGYYTYGMTYFVNFAQELYEYSDGKRDLFTGDWNVDDQSDRIARLSRIAGSLGKCFFKDGKIVSFSDDSSQDTYRLGMYCVMAMHFPELTFPPVSRAAGLHGDFCYRFAALKMDLLYTRKYIEEFPPNASGQSQRLWDFHIFPDAQWCIGSAASGAGFACKGGNNGEAHNHNDIGHFIYEKNNVMFLTDLGAGEYTKDYFGEKRYSILCNGSFGHSVPIICGAFQCAGAEYRCESFKADEMGCVEMDLRHAYPEGLLEKCIRRFRFDLQTGMLVVDDFFQFPESIKADPVNTSAPEKQVTENLITQIRPVVTEQGILLEKDGECALITIREPAMPLVQVRKYVHKNPKGKPEDVYAIQWQMAATDKTVASSFAVSSKEGKILSGKIKEIYASKNWEHIRL